MANPTVLPLCCIRTAGFAYSLLHDFNADLDRVESDLSHAALELEQAYQAFQHELDALWMHQPPHPKRDFIYKTRQKFFTKKQVPQKEQIEDFPALLSLVEKINQCRSQLQKAQKTFEDLYDESLQNTFANVLKNAENPDFQHALLFASHSLLQQIPRLKERPIPDWRKKERQIAFSLARYLVRGASKTSPFSQLTTLSTYQFGQEDGLPFGKSIASPNVALLTALYTRLLDEPVFYRALPVRLNPSIGSLDAAIYTCLRIDGEQDVFNRIEADTFLRALALDLHTQSELRFSDLCQTCMEWTDSTHEQMEAFLLELASLGFLEWVLPEQGLQPNWASRLYQYMGTLPPEPLIIDSANLLLWWRTAAKALPFQSTEEAMESLHATIAETRHIMQRHGMELPEIPHEQWFYEDVEKPADLSVPEHVIQIIAGELWEQWLQSSPTLPPLRARINAFGQAVLKENESMPLLDFFQKWLEKPDYKPGAAHRATSSVTHGVTQSHPVSKSGFSQKIGALLQFYPENGAWKAVVNALYPGGGKMFARWLPLFSPQKTELLIEWNKTDHAAAFPWHNWNNANFQSDLFAFRVEAPGARLRGKSTPFRLSELSVQLENGKLLLGAEGQPLQLIDLGLEAPEGKSPLAQFLYHIGVPYVSRTALLEGKKAFEKIEDLGVFSPRVEAGSLVLGRAEWRIDTLVWQNWLHNKDFVFFENLRKTWKKHSLPVHFYAHTASDKPQYFHLDSPLLIQLFEKYLRSKTGTMLTVTEMLPLPGKGHAKEVVLEFEFVGLF